jgi:hypothetical protein
VQLLKLFITKSLHIMTQEKLHLCEVTLQDMYALLKRSKELALDMAQQLEDDNNTARNYMEIAGYMSECATMPLFNCAGALGLDLATWAGDFNKGYEKVKEGAK